MPVGPKSYGPEKDIESHNRVLLHQLLYGEQLVRHQPVLLHQLHVLYQ